MVQEFVTCQKNTVICHMGIVKCEYLHNKKQFDDEKEMCEFLLKNAPGITENNKNELRCKLLFCEIIGLCRKDEIDRIYTEQLKKYIEATSSYISRRRLMYAYALLVEHNDENAQKELATFEKLSKTYDRVEIEDEQEMITLINEKSRLRA